MQSDYSGLIDVVPRTAGPEVPVMLVLLFLGLPLRTELSLTIISELLWGGPCPVVCIWNWFSASTKDFKIQVIHVTLFL